MMRELIDAAKGKEITLPADELLALISGCFLSINGVDLKKNNDEELNSKIKESASKALRGIGVNRLHATLTENRFLGIDSEKQVELKAS